MSQSLRRLDWKQLWAPATLLTLSRFPMAVLVWVHPHSVPWVLGWVVAAGLSDVFDGWLARRQGLDPENLGAFLDPLADKAFVLSTLAAVWMSTGESWWWAALAATREWFLLPLAALKYLVPAWRDRRIPWRAKALGKATTVAQFALFVACLSQQRDWLFPLAALCGALGLGAGVQYVVRARWALRQPVTE